MTRQNTVGPEEGSSEVSGLGSGTGQPVRAMERVDTSGRSARLLLSSEKKRKITCPPGEKKQIRQINFVTFPCFDGRSSPEQAAGRIVLITALCCTTVVSPVALLIIGRKNFRSKSFPTVQQKYFRGFLTGNLSVIFCCCATFSSIQSLLKG